MPAIDPTRLKFQITELVARIASHTEFIKALRDILDFYADRTKRPGRGGKKLSLQRAYNVPRQVMRQVETSLHQALISDQGDPFALADLLWQEDWLECRLLALDILKWIPLSPPDRILERVRAWAVDCGEDPRLGETLAEVLLLLWEQYPKIIFRMLESWLRAANPAMGKLGLNLIASLVDDPDFDNLPTIFNLISPFVQRTGPVPDSALQDVIRALARRSPQETAYFLKQNVLIYDRPGIRVLLRQSLDAFPQPNRENLRAFLRQQRDS